MTIIEAARSGKRFKRKTWIEFITELDNPSRGLCISGSQAMALLRLEDILATDWEIEEKKVEITYEQLENAVKDSCPPVIHFSGSIAPRVIYPNIKIIAEKLGLL